MGSKVPQPSPNLPNPPTPPIGDGVNAGHNGPVPGETSERRPVAPPPPPPKKE